MSVEELKKLYEEDCKHSDEPWQWWQIKSITEKGWWIDLRTYPVWDPFEYRRKPDAPDWNSPVPHCHAENMALYAEDAKLSARPWDNWQYKIGEAHWQKCVDHPGWGEEWQFRRKPTFVVINGVEVPSPVTKPLKKGDIYYVPSLGNLADLVVKQRWDNLAYQSAHLQRGLIQLTEEGALKLREALLKPLKETLEKD